MSVDTITHLILQYRYLILFPLACFEGPMVAFAVGTLVALGYFNMLAAYGLLVLGDLIPDTVYFYLGRYGSSKKIVQNILAKAGMTTHMGVVGRMWEMHGRKTMFFSKLAYGLSTAFLISAGLVKMQPSRFFRYAIPITLIQYALLLFLGYHFGAQYFELITGSVNGVGVAIAAVVVVGVLYYFLTRYMRGRLLAQEREVEGNLKK